MRTTATHVYFWSGPLSNWHLGARFAGGRAYDETVKRLDAIKAPRPADAALSSRLLRASTFSCGEQWMMAAKCWLLDREGMLENAALSDAQVLQAHAAAMLPEKPADGMPGAKLWGTTLARVLRDGDPRSQKAIGRSILRYDEELWDAARVPCVVGGSVARFEADRKALSVLRSTGDRVLVEGSPHDRIWGVGIRWDDDRILDPMNWLGRNLLGTALGETREAVGA